jgi:hypothetical protein
LKWCIATSTSTFANLSEARFSQGTQAATLQLYDEAAYLFNELYIQLSQRGDISFALWAIFDPSQVEKLGWLGQRHRLVARFSIDSDLHRGRILEF